MLFTNGTYYIFLIAVFFGYWTIANRVRARVVFLLVVNCLFYLVAGGPALLLLGAISAIDFAVTRSIARHDDRTARRRLLLISLVTDVGVLCVFKYANFLIDTASTTASTLGIAFSSTHLNMVAPIGISFFIFQSLACVIDVYRKDAEPAESYLDYLTYVSFFRQSSRVRSCEANNCCRNFARALRSIARWAGRRCFLLRSD
jgi:D-alanyl-lipoteichoic acid acyltransferase DltB (MBOAT superfamily)